MALMHTHKQSLTSGEVNESKFGVGDTVRVHQRIQEGEKTRVAIFEGMVMGIKGKGENKMFTVRRIGAQKVGIEQIFPLLSPAIEKIEVKRDGHEGVRQAKLYFTRSKPKREIEKIYSRAARKNKEPNKPKAKVAKKVTKKSSTKTSA